MKSKRGHWPALEALSGGAVMAEWALELGDELERARSFLRSSGINADTYPCTNRFACECRHRVEPLRRGGWVAVCDCGGCEPIRLSEREVALFEPDVARLAEAVLILLRMGRSSCDYHRARGVAGRNPGRGADAGVLVGGQERRPSAPRRR